MGALRFLMSRDFSGLVIYLLSSLCIIFVAQPIHEFAHGWMAYKLGDPTAKNQGRLTLNPLAHMDPLGSLCILLFGIGWAHPVPVNAFFFKKRKLGILLSALAGPLSNLLVSLLVAILFNIAYLIVGQSAVMMWVYVFVYYFVAINCVLAVFNLLPIPPLDGSRIFGAILPERWTYKIMKYENIIRIVLLVLLFTRVLSPLIGFLQSHAVRIVFAVADWPFRLFGVL